MNCPHTDCAKSNDCVILDIIGKIPVSMDKCSYSKTNTQIEKEDAKAQKKAAKETEPKKPTFKKDKKFKAKKNKGKVEVNSD
jgi:hypothetical protein